MKVLIYNNLTNKMETYNRNLNDPMPYSKDRYLTVKEFRGSSKSDTIWADRRAIEAFNKLRTLYGRPIKVGYAFKRITEGGHTGQSQHYAGTAFDIAQNLSTAEKINTIANKYYPGLSRGIYKKEGPGVDGIYNQDISPNSILIEVGGVDNNIDEVLNTTEAISNILYYYIKGENNG